ncbi:MAG: 1,4-alpha-glucan branching protein GlgB [Eubacteriales bacterium]|nr:1,4-alpha-glucan branching protein GlgB [Eubacteriales bacterium]
MNDTFLFNRGENYQAYNFLGSLALGDREAGFSFRVYAPHAKSVRVVGDFNDWNPEALYLKVIGDTGIFEGIEEKARHWDRYKYAIETSDGRIIYKQDPFARHQELRPSTASICYAPEEPYQFSDAEFLEARSRIDARELRPLNIYECHLGSWRKYADGHYYNYRELAHQLADYLNEFSYNAIEIMPITEYPLDDSWGYQVTGYFAPTSRYGSPEDFKYFVDYMHSHGIRVILDWVPGHFPKDDFALAKYDGEAVYEYANPLLGENPEWGTLVFDYSRAEVQSFLLSSAYYWLDEFHVDGLRVDAVSSFIYLDFARKNAPKNRLGGNINLEAVEFLKRLNHMIREKKPGVLSIAEESTTFEGISHPIEAGGLGFSHKWNMGWMHDCLDYMELDYYARRYHHHRMTFSMTYAFQESFVLALSHDEVVHGKKSLIGRMPGDIWRQCASLRTLFAWQIAHPGAVLNFMGGEFGQFVEWRFKEELEWFMLEFEHHRQIHDYVRDLNRFYLSEKALWEDDHSWSGFHWINADDADNSIYIFERLSLESQERILVVFNMTPAVHDDYLIQVEDAGNYRLIFNSDELRYGGAAYLSDMEVGAIVQTDPQSETQIREIEAERKTRFAKLEAEFEADLESYQNVRKRLIEDLKQMSSLTENPGSLPVHELGLDDEQFRAMMILRRQALLRPKASLRLKLPPLSALFFKFEPVEE